MLSDKAIQEYKKIFKKEYGKDLTDAEAAEQGERRDCWGNIQRKVIPSLYYDGDDKVWIKEWQLHAYYNLHPATRNKLRRQGILKGRDLKRPNGSVYCTVYLVNENAAFLGQYPKKPKLRVRYIDPQGEQTDV